MSNELYSIVEVDVNGTPRYAVKLTQEFTDVSWYVDGVELVEPENQSDPLTLKYEYHIIEGEVPHHELAQFENSIGDVVLELIRIGIEQENLVFRGGV